MRVVVNGAPREIADGTTVSVRGPLARVHGETIARCYAALERMPTPAPAATR